MRERFLESAEGSCKKKCHQCVRQTKREAKPGPTLPTAAGQGSPVMQPAARAHLGEEGTERIWRNTTRVSQLLTGLLAWTCFLTLSVTACPISFPGEVRLSGKNLSTTSQKLKFESQFCFLVGDLKKITLEF